jgi:hypothetical protein
MLVAARTVSLSVSTRTVGPGPLYVQSDGLGLAALVESGTFFVHPGRALPMSELHDDLRSAFETEGFDVDDVTQNRSRIEVALLTDDAEADRLRSIVRDTVGEDQTLGLDVSTDSPEGQDGVSTVVSFRHRG